MSYDDVRAMALALPQVEEAMSYGKPSFKAFGKFLTRVRREDQSIVLTGVTFDEREMLMEAEPETFHLTPHYKDTPRCWPGWPAWIRGRCETSWSAGGASWPPRPSSRILTPRRAL